MSVSLVHASRSAVGLTTKVQARTTVVLFAVTSGQLLAFFSFGFATFVNAIWLALAPVGRLSQPEIAPSSVDGSCGLVDPSAAGALSPPAVILACG